MNEKDGVISTSRLTGELWKFNLVGRAACKKRKSTKYYKFIKCIDY
jgi:hypothetical protein